MDKISSLPPVTINVTVKNAEGTIKKCVESLLALDYPNKKIYITEAYSTDKTYEVLEQFGNKIKLERVKGNAPTTFNHMIKKASTPFIAFTDADCTVDKNWLKNLVKAFTHYDIVACGGFCKTPKNVNNLQRLIGVELENRFHKMPKYVSRLPTMNLCVRAEVAKKIKMDDSLDVAFEADWGNKLTKYGKMSYVPGAVVYHYHRSTIKNFFKQQFNYGKYAIKSSHVYISNGRFGDYISKPIMGLQLLAFNIFSLSLLASLISQQFITTSAILFSILLIFYLIDIFDFSKNIIDILNYLFLFFMRTSAWTLGILVGISEILRGK